MKEKEKSLQAERFDKVLNNLKECGITPSKIASIIKDEVNIQIDSSKIHQFRTSYKIIPEEVKIALHKYFNVNPNFIEGKSESMYDGLKVESELFEKLVESFSVEKRYYFNSDNQELCSDFLILEVNHYLYNFLIESANLQALKKQDKKLYFEKIVSILIKYNKIKKEGKTKETSYGKYAVLPEDYLLEIADDNEESHYVLNPQGYKIHDIPRNDNSNFKD